MPGPGDLKILGMIAALAVAVFLAALLCNLGVFLMKRPLTVAVLAAALLLMGCASASGLVAFEMGLRAAGLSLDAYCAMAPEGRAEIRARLNLPHLVQCADDPDPMAGPPLAAPRAIAA